MDRIVNVTLAEKKYPLLFSVRAAKEVFERYQDLTGVQKAILAEGNIDTIVYLLAVMLREGARYEKLAHGVDVTPPSADDLETLVSFYDTELQGALIGAIFNSSYAEIELEADQKNV